MTGEKEAEDARSGQRVLSAVRWGHGEKRKTYCSWEPDFWLIAIVHPMTDRKVEKMGVIFF